MKGVVVTPKAPRLCLPCCVVLIQPQTIRDFLDSQSWDDVVDSFTRQNVDPAALSVPRLPSFDEAFRSRMPTIDTKARLSPHQNQLGPSVTEPSYSEDPVPPQWLAPGGQSPLTEFPTLQVTSLLPPNPSGEHHISNQLLMPQSRPPYRELPVYLSPQREPSCSASDQIYEKLVGPYVQQTSRSYAQLSFMEQGQVSYNAQPHSTYSVWSRPPVRVSAQLDSAQEQSDNRRNFPMIRSFGSAYPAFREAPAKPKNRQIKTTSKGRQKVKRLNTNSRYFEFRTKLLGFIKGKVCGYAPMSNVIEGLPEEDTTPLALMLRCFEAFTTLRAHELKAPNFFEALPGHIPWTYHWLRYAFSPNDQSCILDFELKKDYRLPVVKPDDVSEQVWAMIVDKTKPKQAQAFYNAVYQLHEAWKVKCRRPPPVEETVLDEVIEERLQLCERPLRSLENSVVASRQLGRMWFMTVASQVFQRRPINEEATRPDDEFYQLMMGVAAMMGLESQIVQACGGNFVSQSFTQMAVQLIGARYRGPNGESVFDNLLTDPSGIRQCVKRGYLKPELLMSVTSGFAQRGREYDNYAELRFVSMVLRKSADLFLQWSKLYESEHASKPPGSHTSE
eukprot:Blabericola_migrator_1__7716@NODE_393_length_9011_cov_44_629360_g313_i0_p3_GENE_NODE_393_length_9011_cov_44_629360_g313_i0NODE_393_length_9011_cov_44_629360_g313_i0_p3_ORF_typecomplete_len616_score62_89_NODE_393_length_9011_cov_44_629360_g313_i032655112